MTLAAQQFDKLILPLPALAVWSILLAGIAGWAILHYLPTHGKKRWLSLTIHAARLLTATAVLLAVAQISQYWLLLTTSWPIWPIAIGAALACETVLTLYRLERKVVKPRTGYLLLSARMLLILLVAVMLIGPVRASDHKQEIRRTLAIVLDQSASMNVHDTGLSPSERLRLAEMLGIDHATRPYKFETIRLSLERLRQSLCAQADWLVLMNDLAAGPRQKQLAARREDLSATLTAAHKTAAAHLDDISAPLVGKLKIDDSTRATLLDVKARLSSLVVDRLKEAAAITAAPESDALAQQQPRLLEDVRLASGALNDLQAKVGALGAALDESSYASMPPAQKSTVDDLAAKTRLQLAASVLTAKNPQDNQPSLIEELKKQYDVKIYGFASQTSELDEQAVQQCVAPGATAAPFAAVPSTKPAAASSAPAPSREAIDPSLQQTDLAGALQKVDADLYGKIPAGVLVLTDGQHNAPHPAEPVARELAAHDTPVCTVLMGCAKPPMDAAIIELEAPETVFVKDTMYVTASVKLDGLAGKTAKVTLFDGPQQVDQKTVAAVGDSFRAKVQLADTPTDKRLHAYRVEIEKFPGEVFLDNNAYPLTVSVTDEQIKVLYIEGRPRWDFRFLKNLFVSRDKAVRLQQVIFQPDQIEGAPPPPPVAASVTRAQDEVEATALPQTTEEWMKFDVIILGDVSPAMLTSADQQSIYRFVADRGGTLVVVAGRWYMPHAYSGTPLESLMPVVFKPTDKWLASSGETSTIGLTAQGRDSVIMRQKVDPTENLILWQSMAGLYWRYPVLEAKPGASVLAFAIPPNPPDFLKDEPGATAAPFAAVPSQSAATPYGHETAPTSALAPENAAAQALRHRLAFERTNALICSQNVAMGQVLFIGTDQSWRLRYRAGDTYHHKFWGQVLRWATAGKLPAGTDLVKIGTDRSRYAPHTRVQARAKIIKPDLSPFISDEVAVNVTCDGKLILRKKLQYEHNSAGMYGADIGELPSGTYQVELDCPSIGAAAGTQSPQPPASATAPAQKIATEFSVDPCTPAEQIELAADSGLVGRIASLTGGCVVEPSMAPEALASFKADIFVKHEPREFLIWDSWPLLAFIILLATCEWLLRKKAGLA